MYAGAAIWNKVYRIQNKVHIDIHNVLHFHLCSSSAFFYILNEKQLHFYQALSDKLRKMSLLPDNKDQPPLYIQKSIYC